MVITQLSGHNVLKKPMISHHQRNGRRRVIRRGRDNVAMITNVVKPLMMILQETSISTIRIIRIRINTIISLEIRAHHHRTSAHERRARVE